MNEARKPGPIALLGPPCSGKTTQGEILIERCGALMFDTGAELREHADAATKAWINAGNLADIGMVEGLLRGYFGRLGRDQAAVLVGFPRSLEQAERLEIVLAELGFEPATLVVLEVSMDTARARAFARQRKDDTEAVMANRETVYNNQTVPVIGFASQRGWPTVHLDGEQDIETVASELMAVAGWKPARPGLTL